MARTFKSVNAKSLPEFPNMVNYGNKIILFDNVGKSVAEVMTPEMQALVHDMPSKLEFTAVLLCLKGEIEVAYNLQSMKATPGEMIVLVAGTIVEEMNFSKDCELILIAVQDESFAPSSNFSNSAYRQRNFTSPVCIKLDDDVYRGGIESYFQLRSTLAKMGDRINEDLIKAYIMVMAGLAAVNVQKWLISHPDSNKNSKEKVLKEFISNVETFHQEHRDVAFYAELADLSPKYFAKIIHTASNKHPLEWIRGYVILNAKSLLKSGKYSVGQICEILHFPTHAQFNRYFKDATGMSPVEFIKAKK